ncbi:hypothetical protein FPCIR_14279 [Fusarium pseudocircinatum]|uniref:Uncharacterized protein n=1 Tax=Fusarium pseudocircinatum TaxID=56676 RepID=A0A8H5NMX4_9HYPO|nr:hypothetical protein FPCIR_14279 [Fusarium pseudocircinatum]
MRTLFNHTAKTSQRHKRRNTGSEHDFDDDEEYLVEEIENDDETDSPSDEEEREYEDVEEQTEDEPELRPKRQSRKRRAAVSPPSNPPTAKKRGRGRPQGSKNKPKAAPQDPEVLGKETAKGKKLSKAKLKSMTELRRAQLAALTYDMPITYARMEAHVGPDVARFDTSWARADELWQVPPTLFGGSPTDLLRTELQASTAPLHTSIHELHKDIRDNRSPDIIHCQLSNPMMKIADVAASRARSGGYKRWQKTKKKCDGYDVYGVTLLDLGIISEAIARSTGVSTKATFDAYKKTNPIPKDILNTRQFRGLARRAWLHEKRLINIDKGLNGRSGTQAPRLAVALPVLTESRRDEFEEVQDPVHFEIASEVEGIESEAGVPDFRANIDDEQGYVGGDDYDFGGYTFDNKSDDIIHDYRLTKIQLAAVINSGGITMFDFEESLEKGNDTLQRVVSVCSGYSQPLSNMGNMWLALGLWKRIAQHTNKFQLVDDLIEIPKVCVTAAKSSCIEALQSWVQISSALQANGIETKTQSFEEESSLSADECDEIKSHLFRAYLSQLTWCCRGINGTGKAEFLDISSNRVIEDFTEWSSVTIDHSKLGNIRPDFGIYHSLRRMGNEVIFVDWTTIPLNIVSRWIEEFQEK